MTATLRNYRSAIHHQVVTRKEKNRPTRTIVQSNHRADGKRQWRRYETIFNTHVHQKEPRAVKKQMTMLEPRDLAEQIVRAAEAGGLVREAGEQQESRPLKVLGVYIRALRQQHRLSLKEVAERTQLDEDLLLAIELGVASPGYVYQHLRTLGDVLGGHYPQLSRLLIQVALRM